VTAPRQADAAQLRVALVAPFGLRPKGTTAARVMPIARVLASEGAAVRVVIPPWDDPASARQRWLLGLVDVVHTRASTPPLGPAAVAAQIFRTVQTWRPHVVHAFKPIGYSGLASWPLARMMGSDGRRRRPLVIVDADDLEGLRGWAGRERMGLAGALRGAQERWTLRRADGVTVASRWLESYVSELGVSPERVRYLPNGQEVGPEHCEARGRDAASQSARQPRLLWYTRFTEADPERAARLVAPLLAHGAARLTVVGEEIHDGSREALRSACARHGIDNRIEWAAYDPAVLGALPRDPSPLVAIYPLDDDLVNRARCPSKIPQLMALGIPVVAEAVGEAVSYLAGFEERCLAAPGDTQGFRTRVDRLLNDDGTRRAVATGLRAAAERWRWDRTAAGLFEWYRTALARAGH